MDTQQSGQSDVNVITHKKGKLNDRHWRDVTIYFKEYCNKSGLHGMQYIGEDRTCYERLWWIVFVILSVGACIYMIGEIYLKWLQSPVLVSFATKKTPIYEIPFPAVTLCPKVKIDKLNPKCFNLTNYEYKKWNNISITPEEEKYAAYMHVMCDEDITNSTEKYIDDNDFYNFITECEPERKVRIIFLGKYFTYEFHELFKPLFTEEGLCYTFNRLRLDELYREGVYISNQKFEDFPKSTWSSETGYFDDADTQTYPRRALLANIKNGLGLYLFEDKRNIDYSCDPVLQGYTITLHIPSRFPGTREEFFFLPINSAMVAPIKASIILTSEKVKEYSPHKRDCFFPSERTLKYFKTYTSKNCKLECLADHFLSECGCVKFFMPRNQTTKVCGPANIDCTDEVELDSKLNELRRKLKKKTKKNKDLDVYNDCDCLPMCNDIVYSANAAPLNVENKKIITWLTDINAIDKDFVTNPNILTTFLMLYFEEDYVETTERNELYGPSDFLSNFGGILGLFTGFSMLSCIEIIYFFTLRIMGNIDLFGRWSGSTE